MGNLASLERLDLRLNDLTGPIPVTFSNLASLNELLFDLEEHCVSLDPKLLAWFERREFLGIPCPDPSVRLLPRALLREDGNGLSLELPEDLRDAAFYVSDATVVAASVYDGWLELFPRGPGEADVEIVASGGHSPAVAKVVVREAVGTFGIDIVMQQPVPFVYAKAMTEAADWWSSVLDGTEWEANIEPRKHCEEDWWPVAGVPDELVIWAGHALDQPSAASAATCRRWDGPPEKPSTYYPLASNVLVHVPSVFGDVDVMKHEIGHALGLAGAFAPATGLMTEDRRYFIGPRAVGAFREGGGDSGLPGPIMGDYHHWIATGELMNPFGGPANSISLAALADAGYTVDMSKATPWPVSGADAGGRSAGDFNDRVIEILPVAFTRAARLRGW